VGTKTDLPDAASRLAEFAAQNPGEKVLGISVFSGFGIRELAQEFMRLTETHESEELQG